MKSYRNTQYLNFTLFDFMSVSLNEATQDYFLALFFPVESFRKISVYTRTLVRLCSGQWNSWRCSFSALQQAAETRLTVIIHCDQQLKNPLSVMLGFPTFWENLDRSAYTCTLNPVRVCHDYAEWYKLHIWLSCTICRNQSAQN